MENSTHTNKQKNSYKIPLIRKIYVYILHTLVVFVVNFGLKIAFNMRFISSDQSLRVIFKNIFYVFTPTCVNRLYLKYMYKIILIILRM
jgi:hypothetical protein